MGTPLPGAQFRHLCLGAWPARQARTHSTPRKAGRTDVVPTLQTGNRGRKGPASGLRPQCVGVELGPGRLQVHGDSRRQSSRREGCVSQGSTRKPHRGRSACTHPSPSDRDSRPPVPVEPVPPSATMWQAGSAGAGVRDARGTPGSTHTCVHAHMGKCRRVCVCACTHMYVCMCTHNPVCACVSTCACVPVSLPGWPPRARCSLPLTHY